MAGLEDQVEELRLDAAAQASSTGGIPSLEELAAQKTIQDWAALPLSLLADIFRTVLEQHSSMEDIMTAWQVLALVCKGWLLALRDATSLCLELSKPSHLSSAAVRWLSNVPLEVLVLSSTMALPLSADCRLLAEEGVQQRSSSVLRSLMHVSPGTLPLLHHFSRLKQVALFCREADRMHHIDAAAFHQLPKLECLTVAGHWGELQTSELPTRLKHLALSNYYEGHCLELSLPADMTRLEMLSARADAVVLDWPDMCARVEELQVSAAQLILNVGEDSVARLLRDHGYAGLQPALYKRVATALVEGESFQEATLAFFDLALKSGPRGSTERHPIIPIEPDDFLQLLRDELLPRWVDVNPALEVFPEWVRDAPSPDACFVLELVKQEAGKPKSMHFTTPVTDAEIKLLTSNPIWRISWCDDPRAAQVLADPQFLALSRDTLRDLLSVPLVEELDLRPFRKLTSVLGQLRGGGVAAALRRMPRCLASLCLTAEGSELVHDFDAELVGHLRKLQEVSLYGYRRHNLAGLRRRVRLVRILNPVVATNEVIGTGANYTWPQLSSADADVSESDDSGSEGGWSDAEDDGFESGRSELNGSGTESSSRGVEAEMQAAGAQEAAADVLSAAAQDAAGLQQEAGAPVGGGFDTNGDDDDAASTSSNGGHYGESEHRHRRRHGGGGEDDDHHSQQGCQDPLCPLHSGKRFLQISVTDQREQSAISFSSLLTAGFQLVTVTLSPENPQARCTLLHEGSWKAAVAALNDSGLKVLELNVQAATMVFRSTSILHRFKEVSVQAAMQHLADNHGDIWQVRSWNGNTASDGVLEGSRGYALMRRSAAKPGLPH